MMLNGWEGTLTKPRTGIGSVTVWGSRYVFLVLFRLTTILRLKPNHFKKLRGCVTWNDISESEIRKCRISGLGHKKCKNCPFTDSVLENVTLFTHILLWVRVHTSQLSIIISRKWEAELPKMIIKYRNAYTFKFAWFLNITTISFNEGICKWAYLYTWIMNQRAMSNFDFVLTLSMYVENRLIYN